MAQFFKRCSCGTGAEEDISHECFKRNCGSNPTAGLNHLKALSRATSLAQTFSPPCALSYRRSYLTARAHRFFHFRLSSLSLYLSPSPPSFFRLFNLAFVLAPFFSLSGYHIVSLSYPPGASFDAPRFRALPVSRPRARFARDLILSFTLSSPSLRLASFRTSQNLDSSF